MAIKEAGEFGEPAVSAVDKVVQIVASMHGEFFVLRASGRIYKHEKDAKDTDPSTKNRLLWVEVPTWNLPK